MWGCGLKYCIILLKNWYKNVTPYVGVWIEIVILADTLDIVFCHPLCGGVD